MIKLYLTLLCTLFSAACATSDPENITVSANDKLKPLVNEFFNYCTNYLTREQCFPKIELQVKVNQLPENVLGQCTVYSKPDYLRVIEIRPDVVDGYNLRAVMYHELFHCVLDKPHYDDEIDIMNAYEEEKNTLQMYNDWARYVETVFKRKD